MSLRQGPPAKLCRIHVGTLPFPSHSLHFTLRLHSAVLGPETDDATQSQTKRSPTYFSCDPQAETGHALLKQGSARASSFLELPVGTG